MNNRTTVTPLNNNSLTLGHVNNTGTAVGCECEFVSKYGGVGASRLRALHALALCSGHVGLREDEIGKRAGLQYLAPLRDRVAHTVEKSRSTVADVAGQPGYKCRWSF